MNLESIFNFDFSGLLGNGNDEISTQIEKDWDAIVRMISYLIEAITSLFGM